MLSTRRSAWTRWGILVAVLLAASGLTADWYFDVHPGFGSSIAFIGDVDGDGTPDFVVGDPGMGRRSSVTVVSGRQGTVLSRVKGGKDSRAFSDAISGTGDLDDDGAPDFAVGSPLAHPGVWEEGAHPYAGEVWLISGRRGRVLRAIDGRTLVEHGIPADGRAGSALAAAGDVDRDGVPDVAIGLSEAGSSDGIGKARGGVVVVSGRDGQVLRRLGPSGDDAWFGRSLVGGADFDGDGFPDLAVGIPGGHQGPHGRDGRVRLFSGKDGHLLWAIDGTRGRSRNGEHLGNQLLLLPDVDGDGTPDVLSAGAEFDSGRILAISGKDGHPIREWRMPPEHVGFRGAVAALPDRDGDGVPEVVYARYLGDGSHSPAASEVIVVSSRTERPIWRFEGAARTLICTLHVAAGGDMDGDGIPDVVVGELGIHGSKAVSGKISALSGVDGHVLYTVSGGRR